MKRTVWLGIAGGALAVALAGGGYLLRGSDAGAQPGGRDFTPTQRAALDQLKSMSDGFSAVADAVMPSVVTITSERVVEPADAAQSPFNDPFFRHFFDVPRQGPQRQHGLGSGVIVRSDGHILTNNHVVSGANELTVILQDGRRMEAKVVGADARTDLAVLKVDASDLPAMPFGDSDKVRIGEWVLAVGSPFSENLHTTITSGIVSGTGRSGMRLNDYEDFIQTDAAINPGNSGGALVNLDGELIGVNSAIASRAGGYDGIGFAIPSNMAMDVMTDLIRDGKVTRGYLGVGIQTLNKDLAEAMNLDLEEGVVVNSVQDGGPAAKAGVQTQDVIVEFEGTPVKDTEHLRLLVARTKPGSTSDLVVLRSGKREHLKLRIGEYPDEDTTPTADSGKNTAPDLGLEVSAVTPDVARELDIDNVAGVVVTEVASGGAAEEAGIQVGDLVRKVNQQKITTPREWSTAVKRTPSGKPVLLQLERGANTFFVALRPMK
jgi:serine protease Do